MTLNILSTSEAPQGSDDWLSARRGIVTASIVGQLIAVGHVGAEGYDCPDCHAPAGGPCTSKARRTDDSPPPAIKTYHPGRVATAADNAACSPPILEVADNETSRKKTAELAAERISGNTDETWVNFDMNRGERDEPYARDKYAEVYAPVEQVGFMTEDKWGFKIGYSPDGLVGDDGLIEIKSRRQHTHLLNVVNGEAPTYNMAQLQCGLLVSARKWVDYVDWCGGMHMWPKRVYPDPAWFDVILAAVATFETNAADLIATYNAATAGLAMTERVDPFRVELKL